jgi:Flp pilus assembly pilin Flp
MKDHHIVGLIAAVLIAYTKMPVADAVDTAIDVLLSAAIKLKDGEEEPTK